MQIGITGGCGFVGSHMARRFLSRGDKVVLFDNLARRGSEINLAELKRKGAVFLHGDIRIPDDVALLKGCDVILECAAQPSAIAGYDRPRMDFEANTVGVFNVLELARETRCGVVLWSSNKVFSGNKINKHFNGDMPGSINEDFPLDGGDKSIYGATKAAADLLCQEYAGAFGLPIIVNRCSCLAGTHQWGMPAQGWAAYFCIAAILDLPITFYGWRGEQVRDVLFADDLADLVERQAVRLVYNKDRAKGEVYNVGGGTGKGFSTSLWGAIKVLQRITGKDIASRIKVEEAHRRSDHRIYLSDISKVSAAFDWKPKITVEEGYKQIVRWVEESKDTLRGLYT